MKLLKGHNKMLQKMIVVMIVIVMLFNVFFPTVASAVSIPLIGDIASLLVGAAFNFIRFIGDIVEGIMQYFFIGGTDSFWVMYKTSSVEETEQIFASAGYENSDGSEFKVLYDAGELPQGVDTSTTIEVQEDQISSWTDYFYNFASTETDLSYNIPFLLFTPDNIFSNRIAAFDINFIDPPQNNEGGQQTISSTLRETIANWYNALRTLALAGMLVVLVYVGIRMIISTSGSEKAKYKNMLMDWLIAVCMLFFLHYIMLFTIRVTESITAMISTAAGNGDTWIEVTGAETHYIRTNLMGAVRFQAENNDLYVQAGYTVMYIMLVAYTVIFAFRYLKRVLNVAFLTIISPLIVIMYPIDKIGDGKAQGFSIWIKDYIFNAALQPMHLILYTVLLGSAVQLANENPIYAIVALAFISQAEKFLRKIFDFDKANGGTVDSMGFAGGALAMGLMNRYSGKVFGKGGSKPGGNLPAEKNPGRELEKTNKGSYGSFLTAGAGAPVAAGAGGAGNGGGSGGSPQQNAGGGTLVGTNVRTQNGQVGQDGQEGARDQNGHDIERRNAFRNALDNGMSQEEAMNLVNQQYPDDRTRAPEATNPALINSDTAREELDNNTPPIRTVDIPETEPEPDYANMSTMDIARMGLQNKVNGTIDSARDAVGNFIGMSGKDKLKTIGKGVVGAGKVAGKVAEKAAPIVGAVAGATAGFALGATTGDIGNAVKGIGIGAGAGAYGARAGTKAIRGAAGSATSGVQKAKYSLARSALGYEGAMKWRNSKVEEKQHKEFVKDKAYIAQAKDLAAKLGRKDHMSVLEDMYALKSAKVNDDKMIEAAMKVKDSNQLSQQEMVKLASDTSKKSETMLFGQTESKLFVDAMAQKFQKESKGKLTEKQANDNATRYLENMRQMYNESR